MQEFILKRHWILENGLAIPPLISMALTTGFSYAAQHESNYFQYQQQFVHNTHARTHAHLH